MFNTFKYLILPFFFFSLQATSAQDVDSTVQYWTEEELQRQKSLIDASREKLIGNTDKALKIYKKLVEEKRSLPHVWYEIARLEFAKENNLEALDAIDKAIDMEPDNIWYLLFKVELYEKQNEYLSAANTLASFVKGQNNSPDLLKKLAYLYVEARDYNSALSIYRQIESKVGIHEEVSRKIYNIYLLVGKQQEAIEELRSYLKHYPEHVEVLELLAENYLHTGQENKAKKIYHKILRIEPDNNKAKLALVDQNDAQLSTLLQNSDIDPDTKIKGLIPLLQKLANEYDEGLADDLTRLSEVLLKEHPNEAKAHAIRADVYYYSGAYFDAVREYQKTLELNKSVYEVWEQYFLSLSKLNQWQRIHEEVEQALNFFPNKAGLYFWSALSAYYLGRFDEIKPNITQAKIIGRKDQSLLQNILVLEAAIALRNAPQSSHSVIEQLTVDGLNKLVEYLLLFDQNSKVAKELKAKISGYALALLHYYEQNDASAVEVLNALIARNKILEPKIKELYVTVFQRIDSTADRVRTYQEQLKAMQYKKLLGRS